MVFSSRELGQQIEKSLIMFAENNDFQKLYKKYNWKKDTYENGFPDIARLEKELRSKALNHRIGFHNLVEVAEWGGLRNISRISLNGNYLNVNLYREDGVPLPQISENPLPPLISMQEQISGMGPTYLTKVLRFALAHEYGAIDTRIVRVFGEGNNDSKQHNWLKLKVRNDGYGWYISKYQSSWPNDYAKWLNILRFFANKFNNPKDNCECPHPAKFINFGLRSPGFWSCADVEMALFCYASQFV